MPGRARGGEGGAGGACFGIENLSDKIPVAQITSDVALEKGPAWEQPAAAEAQWFATS